MREQIHGGDIYRHTIAADFSVNSNPLGPQEAVVRAVRDSAVRMVHYPDVQCEGLRNAISSFEGVDASEILCGNGAAELFFTAVLAVKPKRALLPAPTFAEYENALRLVCPDIRYYELKARDGFAVQEDLLEELVGNIYDGFDPQDEQEIVPLEENLWRISGGASLEDIAEALEMDFPADEEAETLGGLVFAKLDVIPADGTHPTVETGGLRIQVEELSDRRVEWAKVSKLESATEKEEEAK